ncbi:MAG: hypothetical protein R3Y05_04825 [bacterium]
MKLNLHVHSTCSDGRKTPKDIALLMEENNITFALTDHDTLSGVQECYDTLNNKELLITGMEYSAKFKDITLHILSYNFEIDLLKEEISKSENNNKKLMKQVYNKLKALGFNIELLDENNISKSALADELVNKGYADTELYAKRNIINNYVDDYGFLNIKDVVKNVHNAKGKVFWAHPFQVLNKTGKFDIDEIRIEEIIKELVKLKIDGLEVYYRHYTKQQVSFLEEMCKKYNLLCSTGTDIHFKAKDDYLNYDLTEEKALEIYKNIIK